MTDKKATLTIDNGNSTPHTIDLPVLEGTLGPDVVNVGSLTANGYFTYDPGFTSTASCESKITYIDGDKGVLLHRGYPIEQLAEHSDYLETCYLLLYGSFQRLPKKKSLLPQYTTTPWFTSKSGRSLTVFDAMPTQWLLCVALWVLCQLSTTTLPTFLIHTIARWPPTD